MFEKKASMLSVINPFKSFIVCKFPFIFLEQLLEEN